MSGTSGNARAAQALAWLNRATFVRSVVDAANMPADSTAELCFAGRSNAGKSSAINAIVNHNRLAFVSKLPGRTRELNYFALGAGRYLVDLPGYGYASAGRTLRQSWDKLIGQYLRGRPQLKAIVLIMDIRHAPTDIDLQLLDFLLPAQRRVHILLTKADKLARGARLEALSKIQAAMQEYGHSVQLFSSLSGDGMEEARLAVCQLLGLDLAATPQATQQLKQGAQELKDSEARKKADKEVARAARTARAAEARAPRERVTDSKVSARNAKRPGNRSAREAKKAPRPTTRVRTRK
jgi:GTP-binding protein